MKNHKDLEERERIEMFANKCVCSNLRRASQVVTKYYDSLLGQVSDLRVSQVIVLVVLYLACPQTIHELAKPIIRRDRRHCKSSAQALREGWSHTRWLRSFYAPPLPGRAGCEVAHATQALAARVLFERVRRRVFQVDKLADPESKKRPVTSN